MNKTYQKPLAEIITVRCKDKLLWGELQNPSNHYHQNDAKENQFFGEEDEMQEWNDIFSKDNMADPWK